MEIVLLLAASLPVYALPSIIGVMRKHKDVGGMIVLNLLLGWTVVGWVAALAWAFTSTGRPND